MLLLRVKGDQCAMVMMGNKVLGLEPPHQLQFNVKSSTPVGVGGINMQSTYSTAADDWTQKIGLVGFYGISTIIGYLMPNPLYTYILDIYDLVWFGLVLWHINHCWLFNAKSSLYIHIRYIWFGLVGFYGISTIVGYLMPNPLYTYILDIYDLVWFGFMAYQPL